MPLTDEQKEQLVQLLGDAEPGDLPEGFTTSSTIQTRLKKQKTGYESAIAEQEARFAELQQQNAQQAAELKEYRNKDKSADELLAQQLAEKDELIAAHERRAEEATTRAEQLYEQRKADYLKQHLVELIEASGIKPARTATAVREALAENDLAVVDNDGRLSLQMKVDGLPVDNPAEAFVDRFWKPRTDLHEAKGTGLPSPGAGSPPADPPPKDPTEGMTPAQALAYGMARHTSTSG